MTRNDSLRSIADLEPGDHLCCLYESDEEHRAIVAPYLRQGLERGEKVLYVLDVRTAETILGYLEEDGLAVEPYLASGQLVLLTHDETYTRQGVFDPDAMIALLRAETEQALAQGYTALRITGEMSWALRNLPGSERLIEYEAKLNDFFPTSQSLAICQYDRRRFGPDLLLDILRTHPIAVLGSEIHENFYFVPPDQLLGGDLAAAELHNWIENLVARKKARAALRESEARFRAAFEYSAMGMAQLSLDGRFLMVNEAAASILGYTASEMLDKTIVDITHPDDVAESRAHYEALLAGQVDSYTLEKRYVDRQGHTVWGVLTVSLVRDGGGQPLYAVAQLNDVTDQRRADAILRQRERQYRELFDHMSSGVAIYEAVDEGRDFVFKDMNQAGQRISHMRKEDIVGRRVRDIFPGVTDIGLFDVLRQVWASGQPAHHPAIRYQDERLSQWVENYVYKLPSGEVVAIYDDVTERQETEMALRERQALHREAQRVARLGHWELIPEVGAPTWSTEIFRIFGLDPACSEPSFAAHQDLLHPDDWPILDEAVGRASSDGVPFDIEFRLLRPDGEVRWMGAKGRAEQDDDGRVTRIFGTAQDITERKQAEAQIQFQAELLDAVGQAVIATAPQGAITYWNRAAERLYGWTAEEALGRNIMDVTVAQPSQAQAAEIMARLAAGESWKGEFLVQRRDGSTFPALVTNAPVLDREGRLMGITGISTDISERVEAKAQLEASLRDKELLLQEVHHRVKNNLQIISSLLDLQADTLSDRKALEALRDSKHRVRSMALVHETLYQTPDLAQLNLADYVQDLADYLLNAHQAASRGLALRVDAEALFLPPDQAIPCGLIVTELISNALKHAFSPDGDGPQDKGSGFAESGEVLTTARARNGYIELTVRDNGAGLPPDISPQSAESSGLGLRLVALLTRQLRGQIEVDRGEGTTFRITFPAPKEESRPST